MKRRSEKMTNRDIGFFAKVMSSLMVFGLSIHYMICAVIIFTILGLTESVSWICGLIIGIVTGAGLYKYFMW